jgi:hypothetical protein
MIKALASSIQSRIRLKVVKEKAGKTQEKEMQRLSESHPRTFTIPTEVGAEAEAEEVGEATTIKEVEVATRIITDTKTRIKIKSRRRSIEAEAATTITEAEVDTIIEVASKMKVDVEAISKIIRTVETEVATEEVAGDTIQTTTEVDTSSIAATSIKKMAEEVEATTQVHPEALIEADTNNINLRLLPQKISEQDLHTRLIPKGCFDTNFNSFCFDSFEERKTLNLNQSLKI